MWELVYVLRRDTDTVELTEWADINYYVDVLGYKIERTFERCTAERREI